MRAVAVLLVVFCHLQYHLFLGGYIGVDVFFVISGFLISSVILSDMHAGKFSIVSFYERRIRRIFPALLVMMLATSIMAYRYYMPTELIAFGWSQLAALFSVSNMLFWRQTGYFDGPSALKPFLHTWSLAVEEQFYILFPIFLIVVRRLFPNRLKLAIWVLTGVTFVAACVWVERDASTAFYLAPLRAWELLIGTVLSQRYLPSIKGAVARNVASLTGILFILFAAFRYNSQTAFPGFSALAPVLGAGLIIAAGETGSSVVGKILGWRPVVFIGLISYSLYLWHWPILVFQNSNSLLLERLPGDKYGKIAVMVVSLIVATLSWWLVETPFRKGRFRPQRGPLFLINGVAVAGIAAIGIVMVAGSGLPGRFSPEMVKVASYVNFDRAKAWREGECFLTPKNKFSEYRPDVCLRKDATRKNYLLVGDSLAADLYTGLTQEFPEIHIAQATIGSCPLLVNEPQQWARLRVHCGEMSSFLFGDYLNRPTPDHLTFDTVLLAARWSDSDLPEIGHTIAWLEQRGMKVVLLGPTFEYDMPLPVMLSIALREKNSSVLQRHWKPGREELDKKMATLAREQWKVEYVSIFDNFCGAGTAGSKQMLTVSGCSVYASPGVPLLFDLDHFTPEGSVLYASRMRAKGQLGS